MYEATLHLQPEGDCVLSELASKTDNTIDIEVLEPHDELVTLIVQVEGHANPASPARSSAATAVESLQICKSRR
ncbi:hypothetical protein [Halegenticoccus tardaugens]|uniref:hypothetical protein n=1 Tax=Halegenticoccus tardaugens TaxID=2071624 RepID=UPI00100ACBCC|nr:hypothetical protein [Halegenticoccus tardaugens]